MHRKHGTAKDGFSHLCCEFLLPVQCANNNILAAGKQCTNKEELTTIHWVTFTGVLGQEVNGIWEKYTDTNDVNATDAYYEGECIVTGDDFGLVKLFKFPTLKKGTFNP